MAVHTCSKRIFSQIFSRNFHNEQLVGTNRHVYFRDNPRPVPIPSSTSAPDTTKVVTPSFSEWISTKGTGKPKNKGVNPGQTHWRFHFNTNSPGHNSYHISSRLRTIRPNDNALRYSSTFASKLEPTSPTDVSASVNEQSTKERERLWEDVIELSRSYWLSVQQGYICNRLFGTFTFKSGPICGILSTKQTVRHYSANKTKGGDNELLTCKSLEKKGSKKDKCKPKKKPKCPKKKKPKCKPKKEVECKPKKKKKAICSKQTKRPKCPPKKRPCKPKKKPKKPKPKKPKCSKPKKPKCNGPKKKPKCPPKKKKPCPKKVKKEEKKKNPCLPDEKGKK